MKKTILPILTVCSALTLWGCTLPTVTQNKPVDFTNEPTVPKTIETTLSAVTVPQRPMTAISLPIVTETETAGDGTVIYSCTYQNIALTLPESEVADKIILDFLNRTDIHEESRWILEEAQGMYTDGLSALPFWAQITYEPTRIDQSVISLYGNYCAYTGGAHGSYTCKSVTYDLLTGQPLTLGNILTENAAADTLSSMICQALEQKAADGELFEDHATIIEQLMQKNFKAYSDWYLSENGLCFYFSPYEIGPYASGDIVAEIPYSKLTGILKDDYFPAEKDMAQGSLIVEAFGTADLSSYNQIAELILDENGGMLVVSTDSSVDNIRIALDTTQNYSKSNTVFAAGGLTPGDAIVIQMPSEGTISITYTAHGEEITQTLDSLLS